MRREDWLSNQLIGAAIEVHKHLGPGLLESAYEECLAHELSLRNLVYERQQPLPVCYKGVLLDSGYRLDLVLEGLVIVELKSVDELAAIHEAQLLTYLKLSGCKLGLLINFNVTLLKDGLKRLVHNF
jgi:GxxExxY protein